MTTIHELDLTPAFETENERRLRLLSEATEHMLFCERDFEEMGEAAVTPFSTSHWKEE